MDREIVFVGSALRDLTAFPDPAKKTIGYALRLAQRGGQHPDAKPMVGFSGVRVMEIIADHDSDTYRTMYTVSLDDIVFALHAFQKKSTHGAKTPKRHIDTIRSRLALARELHSARVHREQDKKA